MTKTFSKDCFYKIKNSNQRKSNIWVSLREGKNQTLTSRTKSLQYNLQIWEDKNQDKIRCERSAYIYTEEQCRKTQYRMSGQRQKKREERQKEREWKLWKSKKKKKHKSKKARFLFSSFFFFLFFLFIFIFVPWRTRKSWDRLNKIFLSLYKRFYRWQVEASNLAILGWSRIWPFQVKVKFWICQARSFSFF